VRVQAVPGFADQVGDGVMTLQRFVPVGQRVVQAMAQPARTHAGRAVVEQ